VKVFDTEHVQKSIVKYNIRKQYLKACRYIESGNFKNVYLKLREPKHLRIYQFRISKKYRAIAFEKDGDLFVYKISDHQ
jgi:hypothetical protein